ncbi:hypothetical protein GCM10010331_49320 [Streptomyces xanthochromogenes]|uniref:hypothetical protein n=1 Tax=Streptomyces xanthochromogenes TaxID=67384 RepID=UPI001673353D|nr:hypothetical protein [Streptomyces xanthochromogenes]GHB55619.1 hypothetical protein GCM10010331_49320 [Streptomyces xanthochromogenes]
MTTASQTAWPEGVIARYVTVAGAVDDRTTVDLSVVSEPHRFPNGAQEDRPLTQVVCAGCASDATFSHYGLHRGSFGAEWQVRDPQTADEAAHAWAQAHAEKCRAMARPEGN